jgi:hypothetical protein
MREKEIKITDQLWELNTTQARDVLDAFLKIERTTFEALVIPSVNLDYTRESVIRIAHFASRLSP